MKKLLAGAVWIAVGAAFAASQVDLTARQFLAGRASLTEHGFYVTRDLGAANFVPELRFPIQIVYNSASEKSGAFGYAWSSPQLESSAVWDKDGILWTTPWGERIKFFQKKTKPQKDEIKIPFFETAKRGRGFYAPYSDWEADFAKGDDTASGDWVFSGKGGLAGWRMVYRDGRLSSVTAPSGRSLAFVYSGERLVSVAQDGQALVEAVWEDRLVASLTVNGVVTKFSYSQGEIAMLPKTLDGQPATATRPRLASVRMGDLAPETFSYHGNWLAETRQDKTTEKFVVQSETPQDREQNLRSRLPKDDKRKTAHSGKIAGRLLSDGLYTYAYGSKPGEVSLTDKKNGKATFSYNAATGVFAMTDFAGRKRTVYYHMRHDAAYLGKVRKIVDGKGRDVVSVRYDRLTGSPTRVRDILGNDRLFEYDGGGHLVKERRRSSFSFFSEPVRSFAHDAVGRMTETATLDADGKPSVSVTVKRDTEGRPVKVSDGQRTLSVAYNKAGLPASVTDDFGRTMTFAYDRWNRRTVVTDADGFTTRVSYTSAGLVSRVERSDGRETVAFTEIEYDGCGRPVSMRDQRGRVTACDRDALGRIVKEYYPNDTAVGYGYDELGRLAEVTDENGHRIAFGWDRFGLASRTTAADQLTRYVRDRDGVLGAVLSEQDGRTDRAVKVERDKFDRPVRVTYTEDETETFKYDKWGRIAERTRGKRKETYRYDYFGRLVERAEDGLVTTYTYNAYGQRTSRTTRNSSGNVVSEETCDYDRFGRLTATRSFGRSVRYEYDGKGRLVRQLLDGKPVTFTYTRDGRIKSKTFGGLMEPEATLVYLYAKDGTLEGRIVNGEIQKYMTDGRGQLLAVVDADGNKLESYGYDPAGNILSKTVHGKTTTFAYDAANQLVSSTTDGVTTTYEYDAAGRMVREDGRTYRYGWLDKVVEVRDGDRKVEFGYHADGQVAFRRENGGKAEGYLWDRLALVRRGSRSFINEPHPGGGNPVLASDGAAMFNDMLGTTLGVASSGAAFEATPSSAFGETPPRTGAAPPEAFFTGKPLVADLGHAFLFRNYRATLAKWQTADPLGYPDGWNQLAYCGNGVAKSIDLMGASVLDPWFEDDQGRAIFNHWLEGSGSTFISVDEPFWADYMRANKILSQQVRNFLRRDGSNRFVNELVSLRFGAEIENGYKTGYELLHGTNATVGDFAIYGNVSVSHEGRCRVVTYEVHEVWNDIIDPNPQYILDVIYSKGLNLIFNPKDYTIRLAWTRMWRFVYE